MKNKRIILNNGCRLPVVGLSTYNLRSQETVNEMLTEALNLGYRHFDTSPAYNNEKFIGNFFAKVFESGRYKRNEIQIATKLWNSDHNRVTEALNESCQRLQLDYIDIYYVNWPVTFRTNQDGEVLYTNKGHPKLSNFDNLRVWMDMERQFDLNKVKCIGISNFGVGNMRALTECSNSVPQVNQFECHPYLMQKNLIQKCFENKVMVCASCPLGGDLEGEDDIKNNKLIKDIAKRTEMSPAQVILSYTSMRKVAVIPSASTVEQLRENITFKELSFEDFDEINKINIFKRSMDPEVFGPSRFK